MLVLSRKINESIVIDGRITINVLRLEGDVVKLGVTAPAEIPVLRKELYDEILSSNRGAAGFNRADLQRIFNHKRPINSPVPSQAATVLENTKTAEPCS
jgi:carbon storage regulator